MGEISTELTQYDCCPTKQYGQGDERMMKICNTFRGGSVMCELMCELIENGTAGGGSGGRVNVVAWDSHNPFWLVSRGVYVNLDLG